jgi:hypothetical protein
VESAPVKVDRLGRLSSDVSAPKCENLLSEFASTESLSVAKLGIMSGWNVRDSLIGNCAVVNVVNSALELTQAKVGARAPRQQHVLRVLDANLGSPLCRLVFAILGGICALGEQEEPHGIQVFLSVGRRVPGLELPQAMSHAGLVDGHFAGHEDEAVEHHAGPHYGDVLERLLEDDVERAMHLGRIRIADPPEIEPVSVDLQGMMSANASSAAKQHSTHLVVGNHDDALGEREFHQAVVRLANLVRHRGVAADPDGGWPPPLGHGGDEQAKRLLCERHVGIVELAVDPVEGSTDELGPVDAEAAR